MNLDITQKLYLSFMKSMLLFLICIVYCKYSIGQLRPYQPLRIKSKIELDGKLEEPDWQQTPVEDNFMQYDPDAGVLPTARTEVRMLYNDEYLYVGIRAYEDPATLIRRGLERDYEIDSDDGIAFVLDTYNDKGTGLVFVSNTLGARWDCEISADGLSENESYNTFWDVAAHVDSSGYTQEFRIPFSSLRFETRETVTMGFRLVRLMKRKNEYDIYPPCDPKVEDAYFKVSLAREMELHNLQSRKPFYITPYAIANYSETYQLKSDGSGYEKSTEFMVRKNYVENETIDKIISNIGVDAKYGLTKNFTLDATLNTDFAQAESDDVIINLSKYEVNLPEKRSFFLESKNYLGFSTTNGAELFITRSIGRENNLQIPIIGGVRVTGKSNGWQLGFIEMLTKQDTANDIDPHNFFVLRTRKDIDSLGSFVGGIIANRFNTSLNKMSNQTYGLDFVKRFNPYLTLVGAYAGTFVDNNYEPFGSSSLYNLAIFRSAREGWSYNAGVNVVGKYFDPVMGYLDESNYGDMAAGTGYHVKAKKVSKVAYYNYYINARYRWKITTGLQETFVADITPQVVFKDGSEVTVTILEYMQDALYEDWYLDDKNAIDSGVYESFNFYAIYSLPQKSVYSASVGASYGGFYGGLRFSFEPEITYRFSKHINAGLEYEYNRIDFDKYLSIDSNTVYNSNLIRFNLAYLFNTKISLKLLMQYDNISNSVSSNIRFRYNPKEGTDLYIVLNQYLNSNRNRLSPELPVVDNQAVVVKYLKTFGF